jgi:hypothetical protein
MVSNRRGPAEAGQLPPVLKPFLASRREALTSWPAGSERVDPPRNLVSMQEY